MADKIPTTIHAADRKVLERCAECFDDGQDTDIGRPAIDRLVAIGWLDQVGRGRWQVSPEGEAVLREAESNVE